MFGCGEWNAMGEFKGKRWRLEGRFEKNEVVQLCNDKNYEENECGMERSIPSQIGVLEK